VTSDSYAAYGQGGFKSLPTSTCPLALRETYDDKTRVGTAYLTPAFFRPDRIDPG